MKGKTKFFSKTKGWGFITGEDGRDYFVHYSAIQGKGYRELLEGQEVEFEPGQTDRGECAEKVRPL